MAIVNMLTFLTIGYCKLNSSVVCTPAALHFPRGGGSISLNSIYIFTDMEHLPVIPLYESYAYAADCFRQD